MKVVIDTNQLLSSISPKSSSHWLYQAIFRRRDIVDSVLEALINSPFVDRINVSFFWWLITVDSDDNKFSDCAIAAGADYLITEDKHFDILKEIDFPKINVVSLDEFRKLFES